MKSKESGFTPTPSLTSFCEELIKLGDSFSFRNYFYRGRKGQQNRATPNLVSGFTLIETLIYVTIIGAIITSFISFSLSVSDTRGKAYVVSEVQANTRVALSAIESRIKKADDVNVANSTFGTDPGYLSLTMASSTLNPTIIALDQDDGVLVIKEGAYATTSITSTEVNVTNLVFTNLTASTTRENIRVEVTVEYINSNNGSIYRYSQNSRSATSLRQ